MPCALEGEQGEACQHGSVGAHSAQERYGEEEEAFRCLGVPCTIKAGVVCENAEDPAERWGKLVPVSAGVEVA